MEEQHNITKKDKFILTTVLIIIFVGVLGFGANWRSSQSIKLKETESGDAKQKVYSYNSFF